MMWYSLDCKLFLLLSTLFPLFGHKFILVSSSQRVILIMTCLPSAELFFPSSNVVIVKCLCVHLFFSCLPWFSRHLFCFVFVEPKLARAFSLLKNVPNHYFGRAKDFWCFFSSCTEISLHFILISSGRSDQTSAQCQLCGIKSRLHLRHL